MRANKILNLAALALDLLMACLVAWLIYSFVSHVVEMLDEPLFNGTVASHTGIYNDFRSYYALANVAGSDDKANLLDRAVQKDWYCKVATPAHASCEDFAQIPYAPYFALAMIPFGKLPLNVSYVTWSLTGLIGFAVCVSLLGFARSDRTSRVAPFAIAIGSLAAMPVLRCLMLGQSSLIVAAFIAMFFYCWMRGYDKLAGVFIALTTFKIQFITFTLVPAFAKKQWTTIAAFAVTELVLWLAALLYFGPKPIVSFFSTTTKMGANNWHEAYTFLCLRSLFSYLPYALEIGLTVLSCIIGTAAVFWLWTKAPPFGRDRQSCWLVGATIVISLVTSIYSQLYDIVILGAAAVITLEMAGVKNLTVPGLAHKIWWLVLYTLPLMSWAVWLAFGRENPLTYHWFTLTLILLSALSLSLVLRPQAANQASQADA